MKFDTVRAWKDEAYRQTLDAEQVQALEVNPVGELDETTLAEIFGGDMPDMGVAGASAAASSTDRRCHSFSLLCDINLFSIDAHIIAIDHLLNIAAQEQQICVHRG